ncbi:3-dehydroquinate synthase [Candidatus Rubidus massiliensis]|nr:3-dehydroquinate synthase [Candidatus Rubidus massiliensis]
MSENAIQQNFGNIVFTNNFLENLKSLVYKFSTIVVLVDEKIHHLYQDIKNIFSNETQKKILFLKITASEAFKTRETKEYLENEMLDNNCCKDTFLICIGGGIISDIGGFLAATYCRGIPFVIVPTTLLAMVDASIGGKNGVNTDKGKNLIGTIYQPKHIFIDTNFLKTLSKKEIINGVVEMIKHGIVDSYFHFASLETNASSVLEAKLSLLENLIQESCAIKVKISSEDTIDEGKRHLLNFGHTIGHALEHYFDYQITHGEAVAIGILVESYLALLLNLIEPETLERIFTLFKNYQLPLKLPSKVPFEDLYHCMLMDKKSKNGRPRFILIKDIGNVHVVQNEFCHFVEKNLIEQAVHWMNYDLCRD